MSSSREVLLLGDPRLRRCARSIADASVEELAEVRSELLSTLSEFRRRHGFGRAIAAPQIAHDLRLIGLNLSSPARPYARGVPGPSLGDERGGFTIADPEIIRRSEAMLTLWDDCMSFPDLMVKVRRHRSIDVRFIDERGEVRVWTDLDPSLSELLQHEIDHLDGVLATDRAEPGESVIARAVYLARREQFDAQVDFAIVPTIASSSM